MRDVGIDIGLSQQGLDDQALQAQIDDLRSQVETSTASGLGFDPEPCTPNFILGYPDKLKKRLRAQMCINVKPGTVKIKIVLVKTSERADQATFDASKIHDTYDLEDDQINSGHVEFKFPTTLEYGVQYDLVELISIDDGGGRAHLPLAKPLFNTAPIVQFTTPVQFNLPSDPTLALIKSNALDFKTREHDAYVVERVWAPLTDAGVAQTWVASGADELVAVNRRDDVSPTVLIKKSHLITATDTLVDAASTPVANRGYIDILLDALRVGGDYSWLKNIAYTAGEKKESTGSLVTFIGGNLGTNPATLTGLSFTVQDTDPFDGKHRNVILNLTQPAAVVALKHLKLEVAETAIGTFTTRVAKFTLRDDEWHTVGAKAIPVRTIKLKHNKNYTLRGTVTALGGLQVQFTTLIGTAATDTVPNDTAVPNSLAAPVIDWTASGRLRVRNLNFGSTTTEVNQSATLKKKWLLLYNGVATYMDIANRSTSGSLAGALFEIGLKSHTILTDVKKKIFKDVFGASGTFRAAWYAENSLGLSAQSADSNIVSVSGMNDTLADDKDAVNVVDVGVMLNSPQQMLTNGDWLFTTGVVGTANAWRRYTVTPAADNTVTDSSANDVYWDKDNHQGIWKGTATRIHQPLKKRLKKGQFYSLAVLLKTDGTFGSGTIVVSIVNSDDTTASSATFSVDLTKLTSSYQLFGGTIQTDTTSDYTANKFLKLITATTLSGTNNIIMDAAMLVRGKVAFAYTPRSSQYEGDTTDPGTAENITLLTLNNVSTPDLGNPTGGRQGGWDPLGDLIPIGTT